MDSFFDIYVWPTFLTVVYIIAIVIPLGLAVELVGNAIRSRLHAPGHLVARGIQIVCLAIGGSVVLSVVLSAFVYFALMAGAVISSTFCWWKPGLDAPAWQLIPAAILANPLMLAALGFMAVDSACLLGQKRGWDCLGAALAVVVAAICLVPPFGGWLWRWWKRSCTWVR